MWVGCLAHGLDLLIKDICKLPWDAAVSLCRSIVKFISTTRQMQLCSRALPLQLSSCLVTPASPAILTLGAPHQEVGALVLASKGPRWTKFRSSSPRAARDQALRAAVLGP
jgi:hypothetical protein